MSIKLDHAGNDFVLSRKADDGSISTIELSEADILTLAQSAQALQLEILRRHDPQGVGHLAVAVTELAQIELHAESLGEAILMTLIARNGNRLTYAMPLQLAQNLLARLPTFVSRLMAAKSTKQ